MRPTPTDTAALQRDGAAARHPAQIVGCSSSQIDAEFQFKISDVHLTKIKIFNGFKIRTAEALLQSLHPLQGLRGPTTQAQAPLASRATSDAMLARRVLLWFPTEDVLDEWRHYPLRR